MSTYKVIRYFTDLQDNDHAYNVGDTFPRNGMTVKQSRFDELAGNSNKQGRPLIEKVEEDDFSQYMNAPTSVVSPVVAEKRNNTKITKRDIERMPVAKLRELGKENGIDNADDISGFVLKKMLVEKLFK